MAIRNQRWAMTTFVVVTRDKKIPIQRYRSIAAAGDRIVQERKYSQWTVLAQEGETSSAPYRALTQHERRQLEKCLYPTLFDTN